MKHSPQSKPGQTVFLPSAEPRHKPQKFRDKILNILCNPVVRRGLQWLLLVCLSLEEYLLRILLEE